MNSVLRDRFCPVRLYLDIKWCLARTDKNITQCMFPSIFRQPSFILITLAWMLHATHSVAGGNLASPTRQICDRRGNTSPWRKKRWFEKKRMKGYHLFNPGTFSNKSNTASIFWQENCLFTNCLKNIRQCLLPQWRPGILSPYNKPLNYNDPSNVRLKDPRQLLIKRLCIHN